MGAAAVNCCTNTLTRESCLDTEHVNLDGTFEHVTFGYSSVLCFFFFAKSDYTYAHCQRYGANLQSRSLHRFNGRHRIQPPHGRRRQIF